MDSTDVPSAPNGNDGNNAKNPTITFTISSPQEEKTAAPQETVTPNFPLNSTSSPFQLNLSVVAPTSPPSLLTPHVLSPLHHKLLSSLLLHRFTLPTGWLRIPSIINRHRIDLLISKTEIWTDSARHRLDTILHFRRQHIRRRENYQKCIKMTINKYLNETTQMNRRKHNRLGSMGEDLFHDIQNVGKNIGKNIGQVGGKMVRGVGDAGKIVGKTVGKTMKIATDIIRRGKGNKDNNNLNPEDGEDNNDDTDEMKDILSPTSPSSPNDDDDEFDSLFDERPPPSPYTFKGDYSKNPHSGAMRSVDMKDLQQSDGMFFISKKEFNESKLLDSASSSSSSLPFTLYYEREALERLYDESLSEMYLLPFITFAIHLNYQISEIYLIIRHFIDFEYSLEVVKEEIDAMWEGIKVIQRQREEEKKRKEEEEKKMANIISMMKKGKLNGRESNASKFLSATDAAAERISGEAKDLMKSFRRVATGIIKGPMKSLGDINFHMGNSLPFAHSQEKVKKNNTEIDTATADSLADSLPTSSAATAPLLPSSDLPNVPSETSPPSPSPLPVSLSSSSSSSSSTVSGEEQKSVPSLDDISTLPSLSDTSNEKVNVVPPSPIQTSPSPLDCSPSSSETSSPPTIASESPVDLSTSPDFAVETPVPSIGNNPTSSSSSVSESNIASSPSPLSSPSSPTASSSPSPIPSFTLSEFSAIKSLVDAVKSRADEKEKSSPTPRSISSLPLHSPISSYLFPSSPPPSTGYNTIPFGLLIHPDELYDLCIRCLISGSQQDLVHLRRICLFGLSCYPRDNNLYKLLIQYYYSPLFSNSQGQGTAAKSISSIIEKIPPSLRDSQLEFELGMSYEIQWNVVTEVRMSRTTALLAMSHYEKSHEMSQNDVEGLGYEKLRQILMEIKMYQKDFGGMIIHAEAEGEREEEEGEEGEDKGEGGNGEVKKSTENINISLFPPSSPAPSTSSSSSRETLHRRRIHSLFLHLHNRLLHFRTLNGPLVQKYKYFHLNMAFALFGMNSHHPTHHRNNRDELESAHHHLMEYLNRCHIKSFHHDVDHSLYDEVREAVKAFGREEKQNEKERDVEGEGKNKENGSDNKKPKFDPNINVWEESKNSLIPPPSPHFPSCLHRPVSLHQLSLYHRYEYEKTLKWICTQLVKIFTYNGMELPPVEDNNININMMKKQQDIPSSDAKTQSPSLRSSSPSSPPTTLDSAPPTWSLPYQSLYIFCTQFDLILTPRLLSSLYRGSVGLSLSGGGLRASFVHLGLLARLAECDILYSVESIASVSGGSIVSAQYYLFLKQLIERKVDQEITKEDYIQVVKQTIENFVGICDDDLYNKVLLYPLQNAKVNLMSHFSRAHQMAKRYHEMFRNLYQKKEIVTLEKLSQKLKNAKGEGYTEQKDKQNTDSTSLSSLDLLRLKVSPRDWDTNTHGIFRPKFHNWRRAAKIPNIYLHATTLNTGHLWRFSATKMGESMDLYDKEFDHKTLLTEVYYTELNDEHRYVNLPFAVASSSLVPGFFDPLPIDHLYDGVKVRLVDGGVWDNQGVQSLYPQGMDIILCSDASHILDDDNNPPSNSLSVLTRSLDIAMDQVYSRGYEELKAKQKSMEIDSFIFINLKQKLKEARILKPYEKEQMSEREKRKVRNKKMIGKGNVNLKKGNRKQVVPLSSSSSSPTPLPSSSDDHEIEIETDTETMSDYIASFRTALDRFTEVERSALMYTGYTLVSEQLEKKSLTEGFVVGGNGRESSSVPNANENDWDEGKHSGEKGRNVSDEAEMLIFSDVFGLHDAIRDEERRKYQMKNEEAIEKKTGRGKGKGKGIKEEGHGEGEGDSSSVSLPIAHWKGFTFPLLRLPNPSTHQGDPLSLFSSSSFSFLSISPIFECTNPHNLAVQSLRRQLRRSKIQFAWQRVFAVTPKMPYILFVILVLLAALGAVVWDTYNSFQLRDLTCQDSIYSSSGYYLIIILGVIFFGIYPGWLTKIALSFVIIPIYSAINLFVFNPFLARHGRMDKLIETWRREMEMQGYGEGNGKGTGKGGSDHSDNSNVVVINVSEEKNKDK